MQQNKIIISNPCNKDWNEMQVKNNGRHCGACNKTVIDFTQWEVEEIKAYLKNKNERVCGHFMTLQTAIQRPKHHQYLVELYYKTNDKVKIPFLRKCILMSIVFFMFLIGCNQPTIHDKKTNATDSNIPESGCENGQSNDKGTRLTGEIARPDRLEDSLSMDSSLKSLKNNKLKRNNKDQ